MIPGYRALQLNTLAEQAFQLLLQQSPTSMGSREPQNAVDVLVDAWRVLAENDQLNSGSLADVPEGSRDQALKILDHPAARGNVQALRLRYNLISVGKPLAFAEQIEILDQLDARRASTPPQLRLEYGILLFQTGRNLEGDKVFKELRKLWKESEHTVEVPERLRWLRSADGRSLRIVHAKVHADYGARVMARVQEFGSIPVPLRPEEHGFRELRVGLLLRLSCQFRTEWPFPTAIDGGRSWLTLTLLHDMRFLFGFTIAPRTIILEGRTDLDLFTLGAHLERRETGEPLLGCDLAVMIGGDGNEGGTAGVLRQLITLKTSREPTWGQKAGLAIGLWHSSTMTKPAVRLCALPAN